ncbi:MAG TPA: porphobilinogen synthase [Methanocorpusculum sp.]|nr:porphobilinogen synthase [Methanocorpusculum sp.]
MYPQTRLRRLRTTKYLRNLCSETNISVDNLIMPLFFDEGITDPTPITSMPGQFRWPLRSVSDIVNKIFNDGIHAVLIFGIPLKKDSNASSAFDDNGVVQKVIREIKKTVPEMVVIADLCACEYTDHGHCGIVTEYRYGLDLNNDESLKLMQKIALSQVKAGADIVAPSCMLDGMVMAIRNVLDTNGYEYIPIMSYSTKFASALYGPFRDAAGSGYKFGDRNSYQINPSNGREALRESILDRDEGADILMVKPGIFYLDVLNQVKNIGIPVAAYQVSGEYSMIKAAALNGWIDERKTVMESMICLKRAGADMIITYYADDISRWLKDDK